MTPKHCPRCDRYADLLRQMSMRLDAMAEELKVFKNKINILAPPLPPPPTLSDYGPPTRRDEQLATAMVRRLFDDYGLSLEEIVAKPDKWLAATPGHGMRRVAAFRRWYAKQQGSGACQDGV